MLDYIRLSRGFTNNELIPPNPLDIWKRIQQYPDQDWYTSIYNYKDHHVKEFANTHSVKDIIDVTTNRLVWDFDSRQLEDAQRDTKELVSRLLEQGVPEDKTQIFFSGNKGFHVQLMITENLTRKQFRNIVFNLAKGLTTFDVRINDEPRVIRAPLTKHPESGLYKIPVTIEDLNTLSIGDIKVMSTDIKDYSLYQILNEKKWRFTLPSEISDLKNVAVDPVSTIKLEDIKGFVEADLDFNNCPNWMSSERYALKEGYFYGSESVNNGERNIAFMILAATYRNQGFSEEETLSLLEITAQKQAKRTGEEEVTIDRLHREVVSSVYSPHWKGGIYTKDEPLLVMTRKRFNLTEIVESGPKTLIKIEDIGSRFKQFAANFHENRILTGIESLDKRLVLTTGMAVGILGAPSSGKTTLINKIVKYQSEKNIPTIYQSLDMSDNLLYLRMLQQHLKLPIEAILEGFQQQEPPKDLLDAYNEVLKSYSNVHFNFRSAMTVEQIDKDVVRYVAETGIKPKFIAIDYLEKIRSDFSDPTASSGLIASQLSDLAKKHDAMVAVLLQPQKSAGDPSQPLLSMRKVKGASVIEQDLRCILTAWRPGFNPQDMTRDKYMSVAVVKNNLGELCQLDFAWNGINGDISELDYNGRKNLQSLLVDLKEQEENKRSDYNEFG